MEELRIDAAKALMPYLYQRKGETGKKEEQQETAKKVSSGRFAASPPPALKIIKNDWSNKHLSVFLTVFEKYENRETSTDST